LIRSYQLREWRCFRSVGTTAAIVVLVIFVIIWSGILDNEVKKRTKELETANEQLKMHDKAQQEFINVAAHELKTPIQPIISLFEVLLHKIKKMVRIMSL
jgi:signal transduction histidine kinase